MNLGHVRLLGALALVPAGWVFGKLGGGVVAACGLHPIVFVIVIAALAGTLGAAIGKSLRPTIAAAAAGRLALPDTAGRLLGVAMVLAGAAAATAAYACGERVRERWLMELFLLLSRKGLHFVVPPARMGATPTIAERPDAYISGAAAELGLDLPGWLSLGLYWTIPLYAGLFAAAVAWRVTRFRSDLRTEREHQPKA